ncbi:MAG: RecX family transcriptional regulator [Paludibacteraceae bacterium]|nr:RecX family transcriptional regulator [Paludibacteraceae bacterium]MBR6285918.1 RecX family transcriptional regulator [Bacteroidaceae bacterium]
MRPKAVSEEQALARMAAYCSGAEHCISEVRAKLTAMQLPSGAQERIIDRLVDERFIDEFRYCRAFVLDKLRYNGWGRNKISAMLSQKRVDHAAASEALDGIDDDEYLEIMEHVINGKRRLISASNGYELKTKLLRFALSRGFEMSVVNRYLNTFEESDEV